MKLSELTFPQPTEIVRDGEFQSLGKLNTPGSRVLSYLGDIRYLDHLLTNLDITCVISSPELAHNVSDTLGLAVTTQPIKTFFELHNYLVYNTEFYWKNFPTEIAEDAIIHPTAFIASRNVHIGHRSSIGPHANILEHSIIGDDVIIRAGCAVGIEGYDFSRIGKSILPTAHGGGVLIHDRVELKENSCICKAIFADYTEIGDDSKLSDLIHIGHHVKIGKRCEITACTLIAGFVTIGDDVWVGPSSTISHGLVIGDGASITMGSVVTKDVAPGQKVTGNFAIDHDKFIRFIKSIR